MQDNGRGVLKRRRFLVASAACASAGWFSLRTSQALLASDPLSALVESTCFELRTPGFAFGIVHPDGSTSAGARGVKELHHDDPVRTCTLFHMASVTKPFVATAIAQRVEKGCLRLDQRLDEVLPELFLTDPRARSITIEHVMTHSAGLPDVVDYHWEQPETEDDALKHYLAGLSDRQLLFSPGAGFAYSNIGFEILARVIEVLDGTSFEAAVRNTILQPLRMESSTLFYPEANKAQLAVPHLVDKDGHVRPSKVFPYNRRHAGSSTLLSNVDDMVRWIRVNLDGGVIDGVRIMSPQTARDLRTPRPIELEKGGPLPKGTKSALSWFVIPHAGREIVAHGGVDLGFVSICALSPEDRCGVVAMANCQGKQGATPLLEFALSALNQNLRMD